jgi:hypothetical protein
MIIHAWRIQRRFGHRHKTVANDRRAAVNSHRAGKAKERPKEQESGITNPVVQLNLQLTLVLLSRRKWWTDDVIKHKIHQHITSATQTSMISSP